MSQSVNIHEIIGCPDYISVGIHNLLTQFLHVVFYDTDIFLHASKTCDASRDFLSLQTDEFCLFTGGVQDFLDDTDCAFLSRTAGNTQNFQYEIPPLFFAC